MALFPAKPSVFNATIDATMTTIRAVSADGKIIGGTFTDANNVVHGFLGTADGVTTFDGPDGQLYMQMTAMSADGAIQVGDYFDGSVVGSVVKRGFIHTKAGFSSIDGNDATYTTLTAISADGMVAGGWRINTSNVVHSVIARLAEDKTWVVENLDDPDASRGTYITVLSQNGAVVAGYFFDSSNMMHGFIETDGHFRTIDAPDAKYGTVINALSANGTTVGGYFNDDQDVHGFVATGDSFTTLDMPGGSSTRIMGFSADGSTIIGTYIGTDSQRHGFWKSGDSWSSIDAPVANGEAQITAISADGTVLVGSFTDTDSNVFAFGQDISCFYAGTLIATPHGPRAVETLAAGDAVMTADGRVEIIRWLGRQTVSKRFADPIRVLPICLAAGALGPGQPARDLWLSPDHAVFVDGILVHASALLCEGVVTRCADVPDVFIYYHIELSAHELILAEGLAVESFVDNADRAGFDNWREHEAAAVPEWQEMAELAYPRAKSARQVPRSVRALLAGRAALLDRAA